MWLNVVQVRIAMRQMAATTPAHRLTSDDLLWLYCPNCLWVTIGSKYAQERKWPACPRSGTHEPNTYGCHDADPCPCDIVPRAFSPELEGALWTSLRLADTNAVVQLLDTIQPEALGLPSKVECMRRRRRGELPYV